MQRLLVNVPPQQQDKLRTRLVLLGQRIGYEWANLCPLGRAGFLGIVSWSRPATGGAVPPPRHRPLRLPNSNAGVKTVTQVKPSENTVA